MNVPDLREILTNILVGLINQLVNFVPRFVSTIVILLVGWVVAKVVRTVVTTVLAKVGIDRIGDRLNDIDIIRNLNSPIRLSAFIGQVLSFFITLVFATAAAELLGVPALTDLVKGITTLIPKLVVAAIVLVAGLFVAEGLKKLIISLCLSFNISAGRMLGSIVFSLFLTITIINALSQAGLNTQLLESSFNLIIGGVILAFAVGYGVASRDVLANILSSFYAKNRFAVGQYIRIGETEGRITGIDSTALTLQTGESSTIIPLQALQHKNVEIFP
jgi:Conserved TM helix/Mechanosensitive ion channel